MIRSERIESKGTIMKQAQWLWAVCLIVGFVSACSSEKSEDVPLSMTPSTDMGSASTDMGSTATQPTCARAFNRTDLIVMIDACLNESPDG